MKQTESEIKVARVKISVLTPAIDMDGTHIPAKWAIKYNDELVGMIVAMNNDCTDWTIYKLDGELPVDVRSMIKSRLAAVRWVQDNAHVFIR
jgi:regulation of enolase protein 1 (concanavalin A-like superfamily)